MKNWNKYYNKIPNFFKYKRKTIKVLWVDSFKIEKQLGECSYNDQTISIKKKQDKREAVHTFFHEWLHFISDNDDLALTEKQVQGIEKALKYLPFLE